MLMPLCKWNKKHSEMRKSILCLIAGIIIMSVSAVEPKWTPETYNVWKSPAALPIAVRYSLQVCHQNSDSHWSHLTCQLSDDPRTRQYIHNYSFQWSVSFGFKISSTRAYFIYMLHGYRAIIMSLFELLNLSQHLKLSWKEPLVLLTVLKLH